jgi:hypothetical protein
MQSALGHRAFGLLGVAAEVAALGVFLIMVAMAARLLGG